MKTGKPKYLWLASFPRSGNTLVRNVLYHVYGIRSFPEKMLKDPVDQSQDDLIFLKTHLTPDKLTDYDENFPAVYIVRDGRDATLSMAHHKKDIIEPDSDFENNLREAIVAAKGTYFKGWSKNVRDWARRADVFLRFEDLVKDPVGEVERLRSIVDLPPPKRDNLLTFEDLKAGKGKYGNKKKTARGNPRTDDNFSPEKFFRKGKVGGWKEDFPEDLYRLFWKYHKRTMVKLGYYPDGTIGPRETFLKGIEQLQKKPWWHRIFSS